MVNERRRGSGPVFVSGATKAASLLSGGRPREPEKSSYTRRKPCGLVFGQEFDSPRLHHVGASFISLAPAFTKVRARICRCSFFLNRTHCAGLRFCFGCNLESSGIYNNDTEDGLHITSVSGGWLAIVQGFAGMRTADGKLSFAPFCPKN